MEPKEEGTRPGKSPRIPTSVGRESEPARSSKGNGGRAAKAAPADKSFPIVGIGASAGGLEAFEQFFTHMPADNGMAFVLVPHLDPTRVSMMPELLRKYTGMKVFQATDGAKVERNTVYVIPPNRHLAIMGGALQLLEEGEPHAVKRPVDFFFQSLARDQGSRSVGIVLSGTGTDGTLGLRAIKAESGMAMAQDPTSAKYDGMPRSAIDTGLADFVLPATEMPEKLIENVRRYPGVPPARRMPPEKDADALQKLYIALLKQTGHDFSHYKPGTILRRIERRKGVNQIEDTAEYVRFLQAHPEEAKSLFKDLLINVTDFFRDPEAFEQLKQHLKHHLELKPQGGSTVRAWVVGCSTGEEAYSLAIVLRECMMEIPRDFQVQVFGTDMDNDAIAIARAGVYPPDIPDNVGEQRLKRFFVKEERGYRVRKEIREMTVFAVHDVIKDPPFTKLDVICCRNLLIYLDGDMQKRLLPLMQYALAPRGILFLGTSENVGEFTALFSTLDRKWKIYERRESDYETGRPNMSLQIGEPARAAPVEIARARAMGLKEMAEKALLEDYAPACIVVDERYNVLYIHGSTGKYLELAPGEASLSVIDMARSGLRGELAAALREAGVERKEVARQGLRVKSNGALHAFDMSVRPLGQSGAESRLLMVVFRDTARVEPAPTAKGKRTSAALNDARIPALDEELKSTRESLQAATRELQTATEEARSANEEFQSTNEELQSTNEELETSREELQSLNEELITVNTELQTKVEDLSSVNDDLNNLLNSTDVATIFLDQDLRIKRFTRAATAIFNLIETDVGRPITDVTSNINYSALAQDAEEVFDTLQPKQMEVQSKDGRWYTLRIVPYRTVENAIAGLVLNFLDISQLKEAAQQSNKLNESLRAAARYAESIVQTLREPVLVLNGDLRVLLANRAFYDTFRVSREGTEGQPIYELGNRQWDIPALRKLLEEILPKDSVFEGFEVEHDFPAVGRRRMLLNARRVEVEVGVPGRILLAFEDVTGR